VGFPRSVVDAHAGTWSASGAVRRGVAAGVLLLLTLAVSFALLGKTAPAARVAFAVMRPAQGRVAVREAGIPPAPHRLVAVRGFRAAPLLPKPEAKAAFPVVSRPEAAGAGFRQRPLDSGIPDRDGADGLGPRAPPVNGIL